MPKFIKKPLVVEANQWERNGDHPHDNCKTLESGAYTEGEVVRYFRSPELDFAGNKWCDKCGHTYYHHGWLENPKGGGGGGVSGHIICPGDWIITGVDGELYPCNYAVFQRTYDPMKEKEENLTDLLDILDNVEKFKEECNKNVVITPVTPIPPTDFPLPLGPTEEYKCSKCELTFKGIFGYACPLPDCPSKASCTTTTTDSNTSGLTYPVKEEPSE